MPRGKNRNTRIQEFDSLYRQHAKEVWAVAYGRRMDASLASDITQEVFLRLWREWEANTKIDNPRAWMFRVARNLAEDTAKSAFHRNGTMTPEVMIGIGTRDPAPLDRMAHEESLQFVRDVLEELPAADREILAWRYALDYGAETIAELLDITISAVHMRLSRARQRLAEKLALHGVDRFL